MAWGRSLTSGVAVVALMVGASAGPLVGSSGWAGASSADDAAARAAAEIQAARDRANAAAAAVSEAETDLDRLSDKAGELAGQERELQGRVDNLRIDVQALVLNRFMSSGSGSLMILEGPSVATDRLMSDEFAAVATSSSTESLDEFNRAQSDLDDVQTEVAQNQADLQDQQAQFEQAQAAAEAEVVHLQQVEAQRLEDERVRRILEAQRAEEQRQAEAAAAAQQQQQAQRQAQAQSAPAQASPAQPSVSAATGGSDGSDTGGASGRSDGGGGAVATPQDPRPAAPAPTGSTGSSDSSSNGSGGSGGSGGAQPSAPPTTSPPPTAPPPTAPPHTGMSCPVSGGSAYSDTYGAARSGGRSHQGVDMLGGSGTPLVAVVSGSVQFKQTSLGGNSVWLSGSDGTRYFYAHLSGFAGSSRSVSQGEVIGYMGASGNANGTTHLHFEVHPGGGAAVNPYGYVRSAGC